MFKVFLINMPFASPNRPSIALTQLRTIVRSRMGDRVSVEILYLNQEIVRYIGERLFQHIVKSQEANNTGIGDWIFRQAAFPQIVNNADQYFARYYPQHSQKKLDLKRDILETQRQLPRFIEESIDRYGIDGADIVGFTSMFSQNVACFAMARALKDRNPRLITVMGGANCETPMGQEISNHADAIDFVFSGPSLISFADFVEHCVDGETAKCHGIRGVFSRKTHNLTGPPADKTIGEELDINVPVELDYDSFLAAFDRNFPNALIRPRLSFETSRGCWWGERAHCTFCGLNGTTMAYRAMKPEQALAQFQSLFSRYGGRVSRFDSVDNILPTGLISDVFARLKPAPQISLFYEVKADLTEDELRILANAGVNDVQPGIESLATSTLKLMRKGTTAFTNVIFLKNCLSLGINPSWNLLIGFPGEKGDVHRKYLQDIPRLMHLCPPGGVYPVRFDRYSPYFSQADTYGLDLHPCDYYELIYPFDAESLANLAYYFTDHNISADYIRVMTEWIGPVARLVEHWQARWHETGRVDRQPELFINDAGPPVTVYDSRRDQPAEYDLSGTGGRALMQLGKPLTLGSLAAQLGDVSQSDLEGELALLYDKGLVFREGDRYLSLVLPEAPHSSSRRPD